jgi:hypothetical protein
MSLQLNGTIGVIGPVNEGFVTATGSTTARNLDDRFADVVNVKDFGAVGDGIVNDTVAIQAAVNFITNDQTLFFPKGSYRITQTIQVNSKSVNIEANGANFSPEMNAVAFSFNNLSDQEITTLSSDYTLGGTIININTISAPLKPGTAFKILSNAVDPYNRDSGSLPNQYRVSEWVVADENNTTTLINIKSPLRFGRGIDPVSVPGDEPAIDSYTLAMNARIVIPKNRYINWNGGKITYPDGNDATWTSAAFSVSGYINPKINNLSITRGYGAGINILGCYNAVISNCYICNLNDNTSIGQFGYGVADAGHCTVVQNCYFANVRHGYTTNAVRILADSNSLNSGSTVGSLIIGCSGVNKNQAVFDTHHDAFDTRFESCTVNGGNGYGFAIRGKNVNVSNCQTLGTINGITIFTEYSSGDPDDDFLTAAKPEGFTSCIVNNFKAHVVQLPINVKEATSVFDSGDFKSTGIRLIENQDSYVTFSGNIKFNTTDYFGNYPLFIDPNSSSVIKSNHNGTYQGAINKIAADCSLDIECPTINSSITNAALFRNTGVGGQLIIEGSVYANLSPVFPILFAGNLTSAITGDGDLIWEVNGLADNTISTTTLATLKARIRAIAKDKTVFHDWRTNVPQKSILVYSNASHAGTGASVVDALIIPYQAIEGLKETGSSVMYRIKFQKTGSNGTALFTLKTSTEFFDDYTFASNAGLFYVDCQFITTASNQSRGLGEIRIWDNVPTFTTIQPKVRTQTVAPFALTDRFLTINIDSAVGDTITMHQYEIISNNISTGLS